MGIIYLNQISAVITLRLLYLIVAQNTRIFILLENIFDRIKESCYLIIITNCFVPTASDFQFPIKF